MVYLNMFRFYCPERLDDFIIINCKACEGVKKDIPVV
jgi:hypothetical protein